jgi:hypothetical protein
MSARLFLRHRTETRCTGGGCEMGCGRTLFGGRGEGGGCWRKVDVGQGCVCWRLDKRWGAGWSGRTARLAEAGLTR